MSPLIYYLLYYNLPQGLILPNKLVKNSRFLQLIDLTETKK